MCWHFLEVTGLLKAQHRNNLSDMYYYCQLDIVLQLIQHIYRERGEAMNTIHIICKYKDKVLQGNPVKTVQFWVSYMNFVGQLLPVYMILHTNAV